GIHHIGFQVESLEAISEKLAAAGALPRDDVNQALGVGQGRRHDGNVEVKYGGPDGVMVDVSETGWAGTPTFDPK
ncbi:MAG: VOC family protein, partial [Candidatus Rokuibacteriota bacterium]